MSPSRRSVDEDGNDSDNDNDNDIDDGTKKCTRCIRGPSYKHGHDITCSRSQKYVAGCNINNNNSISNISSSTINNNDQSKQTAVNTKNVLIKTTNNNTKSPELDPEKLEEINRRAKLLLTKAINTKSPELEPELEEQQQRIKRKKVNTNNTTKIRTKTRRVDDGTKECTRCVRGPKYKHGHNITCQRSQNYVG
jgi:hypothetical protein